MGKNYENLKRHIPREGKKLSPWFMSLLLIGEIELCFSFAIAIIILNFCESVSLALIGN